MPPFSTARGLSWPPWQELAQVSDPPPPGCPALLRPSFFGPDPLNLLGVVILTSLGTWGLPQMTQKFYAIKSEKAIDTGTVISTLFAGVVAGGCYFLGGFGRLFSDQVDIAADGYDSVVPTMLSGLPDILLAVVVILVLSASMSTLSSLVLTSSSTLTLDLLKGHVVKDMDQKRQVFVMRCLIVVFIAISVVLAHCSVQVQRHLYRSADGRQLGGAGRRLPGPFLLAVLEEGYQGRLLGQFPVLHRGHAGQHRPKIPLPRRASVSHQRRRLLHGGRTDYRPGSLSLYPPSRRPKWWRIPSPALTRRCWSVRARLWANPN